MQMLCQRLQVRQTVVASSGSYWATRVILAKVTVERAFWPEDDTWVNRKLQSPVHRGTWLRIQGLRVPQGHTWVHVSGKVSSQRLENVSFNLTGCHVCVIQRNTGLVMPGLNWWKHCFSGFVQLILILSFFKLTHCYKKGGYGNCGLLRKAEWAKCLVSCLMLVVCSRVEISPTTTALEGNLFMGQRSKMKIST